MSSLVRRRIDVLIKLENQSFPSQGDSNTLELRGLRIIASVQKIGQISEGSKSSIKIFGMAEADMDVMSTLTWNERTVQKNQITILAGDESQVAQVFSGQITKAFPDYSSAPEACLVIEAAPLWYSQVAAAEAACFPGDIDVALTMKSLAEKMGMEFESFGVTTKLPKGYYPGSLLAQAQAIATHANIQMIVDNNKLSIIPINAAVPGEIPLLTPETGLVGYLSWHQAGISFRALYDPKIRFGGRVKLEQSQKIANGEWTIIGLRLQLESEKPGGAWFCDCEASKNALGSI